MMRWFPVRVLVGVCGARATAARGTVEVSPSVGGVGGVGGWGWGVTGCCAVCWGKLEGCRNTMPSRWYRGDALCLAPYATCHFARLGFYSR